MANYQAGEMPVPGYRLVRFLGQGGFGQVWEAEAPGGTHCALKIIKLTGNEGKKEFRAIRLVKDIRHPHLVAINALWLLDFNGQPLDDFPTDQSNIRVSSGLPDTENPSSPMYGRHISDLVISMGLCDQSMSDRLHKCQEQGMYGIPPPELLEYMYDSAKAIDFLNRPQHDLGQGPISIQHCDIKPQNLMITGGTAQICDFGLAKALGMQDNRRSQNVSASPAYAAPELFTRRGASDFTDQYSLAISYYELRIGHIPFPKGASALELMAAHLEGGVILDDLPPSEQAVIRKATSIEPEDRFPSTVEMVQALREAVQRDGQSTQAISPKGYMDRSGSMALAPDTAGEFHPRRTENELPSDSEPTWQEEPSRGTMHAPLGSLEANKPWETDLETTAAWESDSDNLSPHDTAPEAPEPPPSHSTHGGSSPWPLAAAVLVFLVLLLGVMASFFFNGSEKVVETPEKPEKTTPVDRKATDKDSPEKGSKETEDAGKEKARTAIAQGDYEQAIQMLLDLRQQHPRDWEIYSLLIDASLKQKQVPQAIDYADEMARKFPEQKQRRLAAYLAGAKLRFEAEDHFSTADYLDVVLAADPDNTDALLLRAKTSMELRQFQDAYQDLDRLLALDPQNFAALLERSACAMRQAEFERQRALEYLDEGREKNALELIREVESRYADAVKDLTKAADLQPKHQLTLSRLGHAHLKLGNDAMAIDFLSRAIELDDQHFQEFRDRGFAHANKGHHKEAVQDFETALQKAPKNADLARADLHMLCGQSYHELGVLEKALEHYAKALEKDSQRIDAHHARGLIFHHNQQHDAAVQEFTKAFHLSRQLNRDLHENRAKAATFAGQETISRLDQEISYLIGERQREPSNFRHTYDLALLLAASTEPAIRHGALAEKIVREVNSSQRDEVLYFDALAAAFAEQGRYKEAREEIQHAIDAAEGSRKFDLQAKLEIYKQGKPFRLPPPQEQE